MSSTSSNNSSPKDSHVVNVTNLLRPKIQRVTKTSHNPCIYEIPKNLRSVSPESYTPFRAAIGPYHANYEKNPGLKAMEQYKELYLGALISRKTSSGRLEDYVAAISIEDLTTARQYYARIEQKFESDETLAAMLLTDAAFIVEFFCRVIEFEQCKPMAPGKATGTGTGTGTGSGSGRTTAALKSFFVRARNDGEIDPIATNLKTQGTVCRDMILLENQIPYFIVERVFKLAFGNRKENDPTLAEIAYHVLRILVPFKSRGSLRREDVLKRSSSGDIKHLLHLMWLCCLPFPEQCKGLTTTPITPTKKSFVSKCCEIKGGKLRFCCVQVMLKYLSRSKNDESDQPSTATQLHEAGVRFKATKVSTTNKALLANLSFSNGVLKLPCLLLDDSTEMFFRNLIAFEQYYLNKFHITSYMYFIDNLIDTTKDVQILEECSVIENWLESKDDATKVFNSIGRYTASDGQDFSDVSKRVMRYARRPWNRWKAMLRRDYFGTPWAVISFIAALVLLGLTIVQTIASVRQVNW